MVTSKRDALGNRERWFARAAALLLGISFVGAAAVLVHVETGAGARMNDVHVPADWLMSRPRDAFSFGEPYDVGTGWGKLVQWLTVLSLVGLTVSGIWVLQHKAIAEKWRNAIVLALFLLAALYMPVPKLGVPGTAKAVSVQTAERLLSAGPDQRSMFRLAEQHERQAVLYIQAQIAYAHGDRVAARTLSASIDPAQISSPIEAPYRLQFLQGRYRGLTTTCFIRTGCLSESERNTRFGVSLLLTLLSLLSAVLCAMVARHLRGRLLRVDEMVATVSMQRVSRAASATRG